MIKTVADIATASDAVLRAYLKAEGKPVADSVGHDELVAEARIYLTTKNAKKEPVKTEPVKETIPEETSIEDALRLLQAKGFKDREEVIMYLSVIERDKAEVAAHHLSLEDSLAGIALRELLFADREQALEKKAEEVRADMKVQQTLYEKLAKLKESFPAGTSLNV